MDTRPTICDPPLRRAAATETEWEGRIAGIFEGYAGGRVFNLSDGRRWRQECNTREYVYRERPKARLIWDQSTGTRFLDVEGTSSVVRVVPDSGMRGIEAGRSSDRSRGCSSSNRRILRG